MLNADRADFDRHAVISEECVAAEEPAVLVKTVASILPRELDAAVSVDVSIHAELRKTLEDVRSHNGGRDDRGIERLMRRLLPVVVDADVTE